jgi:hypothetical protein
MLPCSNIDILSFRMTAEVEREEDADEVERCLLARLFGYQRIEGDPDFEAGLVETASTVRLMMEWNYLSRYSNHFAILWL